MVQEAGAVVLPGMLGKGGKKHLWRWGVCRAQLWSDSFGVQVLQARTIPCSGLFITLCIPLFRIMDMVDLTVLMVVFNNLKGFFQPE